MSIQPPTIRSGERLSHFDGSNDHQFSSREFWNKIVAAANAFLNMKNLRLTENNSFIEPGEGSGTLDIGEYNPASSYKAKKAIVFFTPDGLAAGAYYPLQDVPPGVAPDTGAPYWGAWPNSPPGMWG
jgi:hypothetical protein